jgi:hypothetical protein
MTATPRKLTVLDIMILVATIAAGIAASRAYFRGDKSPASVSVLKINLKSLNRSKDLVAATPGISDNTGSSGLFPSLAAMNQQIANYERRISLAKLFSSDNVLLSVWTLALVWLGLRKPRPCLRRLVHEAGWAGCLTAIIVLGARTLPAIATWAAELTQVPRSPGPACVADFDDLSGYVGPTIVAVWVVIAMSGRGRLDWSSTGWLTLITAVAWVILAFQGAAITVLAPL